MSKVLYIALKAFLVLLLITAFFVIQTGVFPGLKLAGVVPNLMIIITSSLGFMRGTRTGCITGFVCGLCVDLYTCTFFGVYMLIYMLLGYLNGVFNKLFFGESIRLPLFLVAGTDLIYGWAVYFALYFFRHRRDSMYYFLNVSMPEMVYTIVVFIFLYFVMYRFNMLLDAIDKRSARRFAR